MLDLQQECIGGSDDQVQCSKMTRNHCKASIKKAIKAVDAMKETG